jgi:hypothetical protein
MNHSHASPPPRAARGIPSTRRTLTTLSGLAVFLTAAIGLAPAASAIRLPPPGGGGVPPLPPPATTAAAHFPLWAVTAIVAATIALSIATTLITLAIEHMYHARRRPAPRAEPQADAHTPPATSQPQLEPGQALTHHLGDYEIHSADPN